MKKGRGVLETLTRHTKQPVRRSAMANTHTISADRVRQLFHYDKATGSFVRLVSTCGTAKIGDVAGSYHKDTGYIYLSVDGRKYLSHRLAWLWVNGVWPSKQIDHVNGKRDDNRWINLREATNSQNQWNSSIRRTNKSGNKGVIWDKKRRRWRAYISIDGNNKHLGYYDTKDGAIVARQEAAKAVHGEFLR